MSTPVRSLLKSVTLRENKPLDIVSFINYPYYDSMLATTQHKFHMYQGQKLPSNWDSETLPKPHNVLLDVNPDLSLSLDANIVLCHNRLQQFDLASMFANFWHLPICLIHQLMPRNMKYHHEWKNIQLRKGQSNIFLSKKIQEEWELPGYIIPPGIPTIDVDSSKQKEIAHIWCSPNERKLITNTIGPTSFVKGADFSSSLILVNSTTQFFPIHALIAMGMGCLVVSHEMDELKDVIEHEVNGIFYRDIDKLRSTVEYYKQRPAKCLEMGQKAKETITKLFPVEAFIKRMNLALLDTAEMVYTR